MTSITWAGPRCVQEAAAILGPQNRTQGRCGLYMTTFSRDNSEPSPFSGARGFMNIIFYGVNKSAIGIGMVHTCLA